jgi:hypothetical protein
VRGALLCGSQLRASRKKSFLLFDAQVSIDAFKHEAGGGWGIRDWRFKI